MEEGLAEVARIRAETLESVAKEYDQLDLNGDGNVDREELKAVAARSGGDAGVDSETLDGFFAQFDANGDGKVSKDEWLAFFGNMFDQAMAPIIAAAKNQ